MKASDLLTPISLEINNFRLNKQHKKSVKFTTAMSGEDDKKEFNGVGVQKKKDAYSVRKLCILAPGRYDILRLHPVLEQHEERGILYEGSVCSLLEKSRKLYHRYLVLNSHAVFIYKDDLAFESFPEKPLIVLPLHEVAAVETIAIQKKQICRASLTPPSEGDKLPAM